MLATCGKAHIASLEFPLPSWSDDKEVNIKTLAPTHCISKLRIQCMAVTCQGTCFPETLGKYQEYMLTVRVSAGVPRSEACFLKANPLKNLDKWRPGFQQTGCSTHSCPWVCVSFISVSFSPLLSPASALHVPGTEEASLIACRLSRLWDIGL